MDGTLGTLGTLDLATLGHRYRTGTATPVDVAEEVLRRVAARGDDHVWITLRRPEEVLADAAALTGGPLHGVPFAVKDNVDVAGMPTTAACPGFAYVPERNAPLVDRLLAAGALLIGKTNLDQFATGLSGTRSPYGACESPLVPGLISGGSSSGSAVAVAAGLVSFAIGTDTAGSGRVPAALTGTVGVKPTRGLVSTLGMVPACASLDCASVFATNVPDGLAVLSVIAGHEPDDPWSRPFPMPPAVPPAAGPLRIGVPRKPEFYGDNAAGAAFEDAVAALSRLGHRLVPIDLEPFLAAGRLLYEGPWVAERLAAVGDFAERHPDMVHPVTLRILNGGRSLSAVDAFEGLYRLAELRSRTMREWTSMDVLAVPTVPTTFTVEEMLADPITLNSVLGHYTTFTNLLDLAALAIPAGLTSTGRPHGITLLGPAGSDPLLAAVGATYPSPSPGGAAAPSLTARSSPSLIGPDATSGAATTLSATSTPTGTGPVLAVVGAHRSGQPLNGDLVSLGATPLGTAFTAPHYRLYALDGGPVARAGLVRVASGGVPIEVELYEIGTPGLGTLLTTIAAPLGLGTLELDDGRTVHSFLCEAHATTTSLDISTHGSWPAYLLSRT
ncbi:allophanate hydrolase [Sphaerisporangium rubeum]|uniref:Allophanate hydrolase n=1 Tax=Sphaerisporangium rubeum TaxID=321317 RepID=A0A7X0IID1_9ACTN|nr:allophanate hydrolase [Sphaerisporangium rubeum]